MILSSYVNTQKTIVTSTTLMSTFMFFLNFSESNRRAREIILAQSAQKFPINKKCVDQIIFARENIFTVLISLVVVYQKNHTNIARKPKVCAIGLVRNVANISIENGIIYTNSMSISNGLDIAKD